MKKPIAPCLNCGDRVVGCHSNCERYIEYTGDVEKLRQIRAELAEKAEKTYTKTSNRGRGN